MGRDSTSICHTCKVFQENGYGSYSSWMDRYMSLKEFDDAAAKDAESLEHSTRGKNLNVREFLAKHDGHRIERYTSDFDLYDDEDDFYAKTSGYEQIDHTHHFGCFCNQKKT